MSIAHDQLLNLHNINVKRQSPTKPYASDKELPIEIITDEDGVKEQLKYRIDATFGDDKNMSSILIGIVDDVMSATMVQQLMDTIFLLFRKCADIVRAWGVTKELYIGVIPLEGPGHCKYEIIEQNRIQITWDETKFSACSEGTVCEMLQCIRNDRRQPTPIEYVATHHAYLSLKAGSAVIYKPARCLGSPGFRPHTQTYMSLTDPGDGHILGTTRFHEWMEGAIIHVEHLERPRHLPRQSIESYRVPSLFNFAKVRLHVGPSAPTTYFVGRRLRDSGKFEEDFLKMVHIISASASAAFYNGGAECKVSMEGLTTRQAVLYMRALSAHTHRNRQSQFLSAAWNLNQTFVDDYDIDVPVELTDRMDIAHRAIDLTALGGFEKVTWDGASDTYPSKCIMYQLTFEEALTIVHEAHIRGLVTYFSAGFKFEEIKFAVFAGVDGIGIGGAQVLRFMDIASGMHGPYMEENIPRILKSRDDAASSTRGIGVCLLARLDTMYFEGSIDKDQDLSRQKLFDVLVKIDLLAINNIIETMCIVQSFEDEGNFPLMGTAKRLASAQNPYLKDSAISESEWGDFLTLLKTFIVDEDEEGLIDMYDGEPWLTYRRCYRENHSEHHQTVTRKASFGLHSKMNV